MFLVVAFGTILVSNFGWFDAAVITMLLVFGRLLLGLVVPYLKQTKRY